MQRYLIAKILYSTNISLRIMMIPHHDNKINNYYYYHASIKVNNAAAFWFGHLEQVTDEIWLHSLRTNVIGYANNIQAALPEFKKRGKGVVVNIASVSSCS